MTRDALISFEDNKPYKTLRRHLAARGLSPAEYRSKWGLPDDYPMAAASYREARASLARAHGFGANAAAHVAAADAMPIAAVSGVEAPPPAPAKPVAEPSPPATPPNPALRAHAPARRQPSTPAAFRPRASDRDLDTSSRHKRWLAMLSEMDWGRIRAVARQVNHAHAPPVLTDLSAPLRVRACLVGQEARFPGEHVGTLRGGQVALLISERGEL